MITGDQKAKIDQIWNVFWNGGISNTLTIVEQLTYLMFIKDLDEIETRNERKARTIPSFKMKPLFSEEQQNFRWKNLKEMSVDERHRIFADTVEGIFPFIRDLGSERSLFSSYMRNANYAITKPVVLDTVMEKLENIDMQDQDTKGDVYEYLLSKLEGGGTSGQFRTPRHIIKLMVHLMNPGLDDIICDPACGTGGFLVNAKDYIDHHHDDVEMDRHQKHINSQMFNGMEFDATMLRIASMNLYLHGVQEPNIIDVDAVSKDNTISDAYTLILANPPFKGSIDAESISPGLKNVCKTTKTELLFLALMLRQLKAGGRAAVIVPDGVLFGSSKAHKDIRSEIVENHKLEAVISMPSGVFKPYAGVSTAIMIFTKTGSGGTDKVWFYDMQADGRSLDDKRSALVDETYINQPVEALKLSAEKRKAMHEHYNLPDIMERYPKRQQEDNPRTAQSFFVPLKEIQENNWDLSINRYKEIVYEEVEYEKPENILKKIEELDEERALLLNSLNERMNEKG